MSGDVCTYPSPRCSSRGGVILKHHCDNKCGQVGDLEDVHGWLEVKSLMTKATPAYARHVGVSVEDLESQGIIVDRNFKMVGGVFCSAECVIKYFQDRLAMDDVNIPEKKPE